MIFFLTKKRNKVIAAVSIAVLLLLAAYFFFWEKMQQSKRTLRIEKRPKESVIERKTLEMPFYVFSTSIVPYPKHFAPSGYMGDIHDIKMNGSYDVRLKKNYPCLKLTYEPSGERGWSGIMWQNPANNWGEFEGRYNLSKAKKLTFWARGEKGGEVVEFRIGGIGAPYSDSLNMTSGEIILKNKWTKYVFPLEKQSLNAVSGGFGFVTIKEENQNGCIFFLDEVRYEGD